MTKTLTIKFELEIGDIVMHKNAKKAMEIDKKRLSVEDKKNRIGAHLMVVGRVVEECHESIQRFILAQDPTTGRKMQFAEFLLEKVDKFENLFLEL